MTRRLWVFGTTVIVMVAIGAVALLAQPAVAPTAEQQARAIAAELRCPDCAGLSAADSPTQAAAEVRREVAEQLAAGRTEAQIIDSFVARYGDWIRLTPPGPVPWLIPVLATAAGALILGWWLLGRRGTGAGPEPGPAAAVAEEDEAPPPLPRPLARRLAAAAGIILAGAMAVGYLLPEPLSLAAQTVVNEPLAQTRAAEADRQATIERLLGQLQANPMDPAALSDLADAYLAGSTADDLQRAAVVLLGLIGLNPTDPDPYPKLISAYVRAEDWTDAAATTTALANIAPDSPDVPFFEGLIAWRGHSDAATAIEAFDRFLDMAPDDGRVPMIRALRQEAAAGSE